MLITGDLRRISRPASTSLVPYLGGSNTPAFRMEGWSQPRGRTVPMKARSAARRARSGECRTPPRPIGGHGASPSRADERARAVYLAGTGHHGRFRTTGAVERCVVAHAAARVRRRGARQSPQICHGKFLGQKGCHYRKKTLLVDTCTVKTTILPAAARDEGGSGRRRVRVVVAL